MISTLQRRFRTMASQTEVQKIWKLADAVCFDVDSTVVKEEGIDELAKFCGKGDEVSRLTREAMKGNADFREALSIRLQIIDPSENQLNDFVRLRPATLTPGISELVKKLGERGTAVYLVSGGISTVIAPVAAQLAIPMSHVFANHLEFDSNGRYIGFDLMCPTSKSGGKAEAIFTLKKTYGYQNLVMIGDGATDLEACPPADAFIGFGGNVVRDTVKNGCKWFVSSFQQLIDAL